MLTFEKLLISMCDADMPTVNVTMPFLVILGEVFWDFPNIRFCCPSIPKILLWYVHIAVINKSLVNNWEASVKDSALCDWCEHSVYLFVSNEWNEWIQRAMFVEVRGKMLYFFVNTDAFFDGSSKILVLLDVSDKVILLKSRVGNIIIMALSVSLLMTFYLYS